MDTLIGIVECHCEEMVMFEYDCSIYICLDVLFIFHFFIPSASHKAKKTLLLLCPQPIFLA